MPSEVRWGLVCPVAVLLNKSCYGTNLPVEGQSGTVISKGVVPYSQHVMPTSVSDCMDVERGNYPNT
jgi:hypothetical protein